MGLFLFSERQPADGVENGNVSVDAKGYWDLDHGVAGALSGAPAFPSASRDDGIRARRASPTAAIRAAEFRFP
jgi:hypothetical protein